MFESVRRTMTGNKQIVIAAIAVSSMLLYAVPAQVAMATALGGTPALELELLTNDLAQEINDETTQDIDQDADQELEQEQEQEQEFSNEQTADQDNTASQSFDETNEQNQAIVTGDNSATTTATAANDADHNALAAESTGGSASADTIVKKTKDKVYGGSATGGSSEAEASIEQEAEATATTVQDSSADDNVLVQENTFGNDVGVITQENDADQRALNVGFQDQNQYATQSVAQDANQEDINAQLAEQCAAANVELLDGLTLGTGAAAPEVTEIC